MRNRPRPKRKGVALQVLNATRTSTAWCHMHGYEWDLHAATLFASDWGSGRLWQRVTVLTRFWLVAHDVVEVDVIIRGHSYAVWWFWLGLGCCCDDGWGWMKGEVAGGLFLWWLCSDEYRLRWVQWWLLSPWFVFTIDYVCFKTVSCVVNWDS